MEPAFIPDALGATPLQIASGPRFHVRVCSVRHRLLDEDNLSAKYVIDMLRYVGFISDDNAWLTKIEVTQKKCALHETEHVEVVIERL